ncbi:hypothetical protein EB155_11520 [archaeon]|nr:hypothetical protein [archaeon]NDB80481.1 hypothetical protein [archaeon]
MNGEVVGLFPTPVGIYEIDIDLDLVKKKILTFTTQPHGLLDDSQSSFENDGSILYDPDLNFLKEKIESCIDDYVQNVCLQPIVITGSWYNQMKIGCRVNLHRHEGSVVSGAFYVDVDDDTVPLRFKSPLQPYKMNDLHERFENQYASVGVMLPPKKGTLLLFPSWLEHETDSETGTRCVISFNTLYRRLFYND